MIAQNRVARGPRVQVKASTACRLREEASMQCVHKALHLALVILRKGDAGLGVSRDVPGSWSFAGSVISLRHAG